MRPIRLTMAAFGPFAGIEEIYFEELGKNPLFLINGPTGSGKTTVLDAICFALYGKTTGDEREAAQMRSDIAAANQLTYVELEFELRGQRWRVHREPDQLRPSERGEGQTRHKPRAELLRIEADGSESVIALKLTEVKEAIEELLGLNVEQFRQVMVLPQGEFRKLLVAKSSEREKVFSHLFQTQVYNRIESSLKEQASAVRRQLEASHNQQLGILESVDFERETELEQALDVQGRLHRTLLERKNQAEKNKQLAEQARLLAEKEMAEFERLELSRKRLAEAQARLPEIERLRLKFRGGQTALRIKPAFERAQRAELALKQAEDKRTAAEQGLRQAREARTRSQGQLDAVMDESQARAELEEQLRLYRGYRERLTQIEAAGEVMKTRASELMQQEQALETTRDALEQGRQRLERLQKETREAEIKFGQLGQLQLEFQQQQAQLQAARALAQLRTENQAQVADLQQKKSERELVQTRLEWAQAELDRLEYAWHAGQAVLLAKKLQPGESCPVCGSEQHPAPAHAALEIPDQIQRDTSHAALEEARAHCGALDNEMARLETAIAHQQAQMNNQVRQLGEVAELPLAVLEEQLETRRRQLDEIEREQSRIARLSQQAVTVSEQMETDSDRIASLDKQRQTAQTQLELARGEFRQLQREVPEPWRDRGRLDSEIDTGEQAYQHWLTRSEQARQALEQAELRLERAASDLGNAEEGKISRAEEVAIAHQGWSSLLEQSPFQDVAEFEKNLVDEAQLGEIQAQVDTFNSDFAQAQGAVATLEKALENRQPPELERVRQSADQANAAWSEVQREYEQLDRKLNGLLNAQQKLVQVKERYAQLESQYALVGTLADTAAGKSGARISLQRFVLSVMLDDVLLVASERLKRMSRGRYTLHRQREKGRGASAAGLDLVVEDAYYGTQRPVVTLSGGESFMAALSLALALSDVVQARSGGVRLDTLFIDEGFGSLDSEALELAVRTLVELQSSGRMVGVISHVPELKEWIGVRLDVISSRAGSTTRTVVA